jgi:hypothetical protein
LIIFHIPRHGQVDMVKSTLLERLPDRSVALLSTAPMIFWGSQANVLAWSGVSNLSRAELKKLSIGRINGEDQRNHTLGKTEPQRVQ